MSWSADTNEVTRDEAVRKIKELAREDGLKNFKVYYDGDLVEDESDLPTSVDMDLVRISASHDNASA